LLLYWCFCKPLKQDNKESNDEINHNPSRYNYDKHNQYYHLQMKLKNKNIVKVEYVPIPLDNLNDNKRNDNDDSENDEGENMRFNNDSNNVKYGTVNEQPHIVV